MPNRLLVIGHPLAAKENHAPFSHMKSFEVDLIVPKNWKARTLGTVYPDYRTNEIANALEKKVRIHPLPVLANGRNTFFIWLGLGRLIKALNPDIIYCWEEPWCLSTAQVQSIAKRLNIPLVFFSAENRPKHLPWPFRQLQSFIYKKGRACIVPTRQISSRVKASGFTGKIIEVPLWILPRKVLSVSSENHTLAYVGRLIPLKRVHLIIESLPKLPGFSLCIIGDGPEKERLESLTQKLNLMSRVNFRGHVDHSELENALTGASLLILATGENSRQAEQFGKAALEGIACGLPVLTSRTGNLLELSLTIPNILAREIDTSAQVAASVEEIWQSFPSPGSLAEGRRKVEETYGPETIASILERACNQLLSEIENP